MKSKILVDFDFDKNETFLQIKLAGHDEDGYDLADKNLKNFIEKANHAGGLHIWYAVNGNEFPQIRVGILK